MCESGHLHTDVQVPRSTGMCESGHPWRSDVDNERIGEACKGVVDVGAAIY